MLNESKGPAVHSLRAQADKQDYSREMRRTLENTDHLTVRQAEVSEIITDGKKLTGVKTFSGAVYRCKGRSFGHRNLFKRQMYLRGCK